MRTVVHVIDSQSMGGTERILLHLLEATDRTLWRPVLFHPASPALAPLLTRARELDVPCHVIPVMEGLHHLPRMAKLVAAFRSARPDLVHLHLSWPLACKYAAVAAWLARVPASIATSQLFFDLADRRWLGWQPRAVSHFIDRYLAVSDGVARQLTESFGIPSGQVEVVRNGIDIHQFSRARNDALRAELSCGRPWPIVLTPARLDGQKGQRHLIEAAAMLPDVLFVLAGDGPDRAALETQAVALGVADRILFLGARDDVPDLLASADLFVLPSLYEGLPLSVMEAMAAGLPVIATAIVGSNELIDSGRNGLLVPPADPAALADAMRTLLADAPRARAMSAAAREHAAEAFGAARMQSRVARVYDEVLVP